MTRPRYPSLHQTNTRVRLSELAAELRRPATPTPISVVKLLSIDCRNGFIAGFASDS